MAYTPAAQQQAASPTTGAFPGTAAATSSTGKLGLPGRWATARVVSSAKAWKQEPAGFQGPPPLDPNAVNVTTIDQMLIDLEGHASNPQAVDMIQQSLFEGGLYGKTKKGTLPFEPGVLDDATRRAFAKAAHEASTQHTEFGAFLDAKAAARLQAVGDGTTASTAQPLRATNPADLTAIAQTVAEKKLGRGLTDAEAAKVTAALAAFEQPSLAAHGSTSPPGVAAFQEQADKQVQALDPTRYGARNVLNVIDMLSKSLGGTGG